MAKGTRKNERAAVKQDEAGVQIIGSTLDEEKKETLPAGETIAIACSLPFGIRFDDIPCGGSTKSIHFPGVNDSLRGKRDGVLAAAGNAVCVTMLKSDWEALLAIHGKETAFTGRNGNIPCIYPVGDRAGFRAARSEIAEMRHGLEPAAQDGEGITARKE